MFLLNHVKLSMFSHDLGKDSMSQNAEHKHFSFSVVMGIRFECKLKSPILWNHDYLRSHTNNSLNAGANFNFRILNLGDFNFGEI